MQSGICIYIETLVRQKELKEGTPVNAACQDMPQVFHPWSRQSINWGGILGRRNFLFKGSGSVLGSTQVPVIWVLGATLSEVKQVSRETTC
jgi:hypothetical protein